MKENNIKIKGSSSWIDKNIPSICNFLYEKKNSGVIKTKPVKNMPEPVLLILIKFNQLSSFTRKIKITEIYN